MLHYVAGIVLAVWLLPVTPAAWLGHPGLYPTLLVGAGTVVVPCFVMQPCLGWGVAAARTPNPGQARLKGLIADSVFGVGRYTTALAWSGFS